MGSPFPGLDPYIEISHLWEDFHTNLISEIQRFLSDVLPDRYVVRAGERSYVELADLDEEEEKKRAFLPDVAVASNRGAAKTARKPKGATRAAAAQSEPGPITMRALVKEEYREAFLEIRQVDPERKLVTGIEVLSPSNKRPNTRGWRVYYRKRRVFLSGHANLVEIDLLRRGRRMPMVSAWPDSPYYLLVCRKKQASRCSVWPAFYTEPLPPIPIPLAPPDADISLDIQPFVAVIYARSRYERDIDYRRPLYPPPSAAEAAWLEELLREKQPPPLIFRNAERAPITYHHLRSRGADAMTLTFEATYENGVLKPAQPLPLKEHDKVQVTVHTPTNWVQETAGIIRCSDHELIEWAAMDPELDFPSRDEP